jgi:hypothetical protein
MGEVIDHRLGRAVKWDEGAERLYRLARQESFALGDEYMGTQHLLLAAIALTPAEEHGVKVLTRDAVLSAIHEVIKPRAPDAVVISPGCQTPRAKAVIMRATDRAAAASRALGVADIWHGLLTDSESECRRVLAHLGIDAERLSKTLAP